jgi:hypothetical protein
MGFSLEYDAGPKTKNGDFERKLVMPGDEVECGYFDTLPVGQQIASQTGLTSVTVLKFGGNVSVFFTDGSIWVGSNLGHKKAQRHRRHKPIHLASFHDPGHDCQRAEMVGVVVCNQECLT